ncbi:MAG TPA: hypothetical protein PKZ12_03755 [Smithellaceae bacterium]|nr:hypothetical protein [Smithellaceae bacterium]
MQNRRVKNFPANSGAGKECLSNNAISLSGIVSAIRGKAILEMMAADKRIRSSVSSATMN